MQPWLQSHRSPAADTLEQIEAQSVILAKDEGLHNVSRVPVPERVSQIKVPTVCRDRSYSWPTPVVGY